MLLWVLVFWISFSFACRWVGPKELNLVGFTYGYSYGDKAFQNLFGIYHQVWLRPASKLHRGRLTLPIQQRLGIECQATSKQWINSFLCPLWIPC